MNDLSSRSVNRVKQTLKQYARPGDILVVSIHWGGNWGYQIPTDQVRFAHKLIDEAGVDLVHGHSSHHVKGIEVYRGKLILYGSGDFLNDYEGINHFRGLPKGAHKYYRGDLSLMYFASVEPESGKLVQLLMTPTRMKRFRINLASQDEALWLKNRLNREGRMLGTMVNLNRVGELLLEGDDDSETAEDKTEEEKTDEVKSDDENDGDGDGDVDEDDVDEDNEELDEIGRAHV